MNRVAFYADSSATIGLGHVRRCMALADELSARQLDIVFLYTSLTDSCKRLLSSRNFSLNKVNDSVLKMMVDSCDSLILDSYSIDVKLWDVLSTIAKKRLIIDDLSRVSFACDVLVNSNPAATESDYAKLVAQSCRLLLGPEYAFIDQRMLKNSRICRDSASTLDVLVSLGGVDDKNITRLVLSALNLLSFPMKVTVVLGGASRHIHSLEALLHNLKYSVELQVDVENMSELYYSHDVCIGAAGVSLWERCAVGLPNLIITTAENQAGIADALEREQAAIHLGMHSDLDEQTLSSKLNIILSDRERLLAIAKRAGAICDGLGVSRVADILLEKRVEYASAT